MKLDRRRCNTQQQQQQSLSPPPPLGLQQQEPPSLSSSSPPSSGNDSRLQLLERPPPPALLEEDRPTTPQELELAAMEAEQQNNNCKSLTLRSLQQLDDYGDEVSLDDNSLSTEDLDDNDQEHREAMMLISEDNNSNKDKKKTITQFRPHHRFQKLQQRRRSLDFEQYNNKRKMTLTQERWNAITMLPSPIYCIYYILAGIWVNKNISSSNNSEMNMSSLTGTTSGDPSSAALSSSALCLPPSIWYSMPALPPLPVVAVALAIVLHAPFSFLYHWKYATRTDLSHWSRRLDQSFIHVASALVSYSTSGSWDYFLANLLYNADCIYRQLLPRVRPRMNQIRIFISILAYTFPILRRADVLLFVQAWTVLGIGGWLFSKYPIGGWSHCAFHIVMCLLPPLIMEAATELPASQAQMQVASNCALLRLQQQQP